MNPNTTCVHCHRDVPRPETYDGPEGPLCRIQCEPPDGCAGRMAALPGMQLRPPGAPVVPPDPRPTTIFLDIDGVLIRHAGSLSRIWQEARGLRMTVPRGTLEKLQEWDMRGYRILLTTGRRECMRKDTERQLAQLGIIYDQLIMGLGGGVRVVINDLKPGSETPTAIAINLPRGQGIAGVEL